MPRKKRKSREEIEEMIEAIRFKALSKSSDYEDEENYGFLDDDENEDFSFKRDLLFDDNYYN